MNHLVIIPPGHLELITDLLSAGSWCSTEAMELVLAEAIRLHLHQAAFFNNSVALNPKE